jgi:hypothetical protein
VRDHVEQLGEAEIEQLDLAVVGEHRVGSLDVAVEHVAPVRRREPAREADAELERRPPVDRHRDPIEGLAVDELVHQVRPPVDLADAIDRDHVRVLEPGDRTRLDEKRWRSTRLGSTDAMKLIATGRSSRVSWPT